MTNGMDDVELRAAADAYGRLRGLSLSQWNRVSAYLDSRIRSDLRTASAQTASAAGVEPEWWCVSGTLECGDHESGAIGVASQYAEYDEVTEIDGMAVVKRRFAVRVASDPDGGDTIEWFEKRADAERFIADLKADAASGKVT